MFSLLYIYKLTMTTLHPDLIRYISTFEYSIACALNDYGIPIEASLGRNPTFINYCVQQDHLHLLQQYAHFISESDSVLDLLDMAIRFKSIRSFKFLFNILMKSPDNDLTLGQMLVIIRGMQILKIDKIN